MMRTPAWWQRRGLIAQSLRPLAALYALGFRLDRALNPAQHAALPVIGIGNVTAGGAGKTPATLEVVAMLRSMGATPHIISRGYGGSIRTTHRVDPATDRAADVGDEPLLLAAHAPTWVGRDRLASIAAAKAAGATIVVADDAMQHHRLHKDLQLLVVDGGFGFGNGLPLPAGPLREPLAPALARANQLILHIGPLTEEQRAAYGQACPVLQATFQPVGDQAALMQGAWLAFAGIARPQKFYDTLRQMGVNVAGTHDFPDHHPFAPHELEALEHTANAQGLRLITTEKDWMRLAPAWRETIRYLPVQLAFADATPLRDALAAVIRPSQQA
ncbi:MAG: tetraacyldisaccharide 4'-kinase [Azospirillum brasilense]|nr:MAG: tetraacyldisaccharide 4'-kinase [Azospirillum brasilense]